MKISARVHSTPSEHTASVATSDVVKFLNIPAKAGGQGSSVNGGELLMLALATCYCNDIYREAARLKVTIDGVEVEAVADFEGVGLAATNIRYSARIASSASEAELVALLRETDAVAEVHNTVRKGVPVSLVSWPLQG